MSTHRNQYTPSESEESVIELTQQFRNWFFEPRAYSFEEIQDALSIVSARFIEEHRQSAATNALSQSGMGIHQYDNK